LSSFQPSTLRSNKRLRDPMNVVLSETKDLTVGTCVYRNHLKGDEAKMIEGSLKMFSLDERSLATLGMTDSEAKVLITQ
jgi:hypothetical protein